MNMLLLVLLLDSAIANPNIDMDGYLKVASKAAAHREARRVSEEEFIRMSGEPDTIVLDARNASRFARLHVKGAINLPFPEITPRSLQRAIPNKTTRILIYCNNNFFNDETAFETKIKIASLNLSTYIALFSHGYENVYELGPRIDVNAAKIELVSLE